MVVRRFVSTLSFAAFLFATSAAVADEGKIVLVGGQVISGEIQEVVNGDYILIRLSNGELKAIAWTNIASFAFGAAAAVDNDNDNDNDNGSDNDNTAAAKPAQSAALQPLPAPPAQPMIVYVPPYVPPPLPPPRRPPFEPALTLGARVGTMVVGGNVYGNDYYGYYGPNYNDPRYNGPRLYMSDVASWGWMVEGDLGYHFSPSWTIYGFWEHGELGSGDLNRSWGHTNAVGVGINANSAPYGPLGFYFDVGASYRWMNFADVALDPNTIVTTRTTVEGFDYLRLAVGASITMGPKFRLDPHIYTSSGYFSRMRNTTCPGGCDIEGRGIDTGLHWMSGLAVSGRWDFEL